VTAARALNESLQVQILAKKTHRASSSFSMASHWTGIGASPHTGQLVRPQAETPSRGHGQPINRERSQPGC